MASFTTELTLLETVLSDLAAFAGGQPVNAEPTIGGTKYTLSLVKLPQGPAAPYVTISGSVFVILFEAFSIGAEIASGATTSLAIKEGNDWYGLTIGKAAA